MASYVVALKGVEYIFYSPLTSQADTKLWQVNPTIASGDFKVSIDGGAYNNLSTLPVVTPAGGTFVKFTLSTSEMNGDNITVQGIDAAGAEWCGFAALIPTAARQINDLAFPTTTGRGLDVTAGGNAGIDWANVEAPTTSLALTGTTIATTQVVASVSGAVGSVTGAVGSVTADVSADIVSINGTTVTGDGSLSTPWGP